MQTLLVIGHEPVMSGLALGLADDSSDAGVVAAIEAKYPTSALALLRVSTPWRELELGGAQLAGFHIPR